ncbi:hypothetical protein O4215_20565 [Rhodococcus maanshanensis]|uniref:hypothetical protein n=1 Tax=Rhodococcus maanshanensis TaxID=183556 RepID=UPI0022B4277E|nr:hypothetical protein [Rhodococcus maanshanensis]MCZ4557958.1 hypothetical protein [Rhodococcus maanshanensis]
MGRPEQSTRTVTPDAGLSAPQWGWIRPPAPMVVLPAPTAVSITSDRNGDHWTEPDPTPDAWATLLDRIKAMRHLLDAITAEPPLHPAPERPAMPAPSRRHEAAA